MKIFIKIIFAFILIATNVNAQSLWLVDYGYNNIQCDYLVENISVDSLKNIVLTDDWVQSSQLYECAVTRLYYFHKETESQFLINNLNTVIDSIEVPQLFLGTEWYKFYTDAYILGLLGSQIAIEKMRVIANDDNSGNRLYAMSHLAEAGYYEYYDFLINEYYSGNKNPYILNLLGWYSRSENYRDQIKSILRNEVYSESDYFGVISKAHNLSFIPGAEVEILDEYFRNTTGKERYDYFFHISSYDEDGQVERSMFALQNETNDTFRFEYLPSVNEILNYSSRSKRYLEPMFVNFLRTLSISDTNSSIHWLKKAFLISYRPAKPDTTQLPLDLIGNLYNYVDSVIAYNWLGDITFATELKNILTRAKIKLQYGDSLACRIQLKAFQDLVDNVHKESPIPDSRFVTVQG